MRRLLLFLLIFAVGFAVLLFFQEGSREKTPPAPDPVAEEQARPTPSSEPAAEEPETAPVGDAPGPEAPEVATQLPEGGGNIKIGGETSILRYDGPGGPLRYRLLTADLRSVSEDSYELFSVVMEFHDPDTGEVQTTLEAATGRVRARLTETGFEIEEEHEVVLSDVDVMLHSGTPLAPLRAHVPEMSLRVDDQRLRSDSEVLIEGRGLQITGQGLLIERGDETIRIEREPRVQMRFEDGSRAALRARGDLLVTASGSGDERQIELVASRSAHFDFVADGEARLSAETIRLVGRAGLEVDSPAEAEEGSDDSRFEPRILEVSGEATFANSDGFFEGERGELFFDAEGAAQRAVLEGDPKFRLDLSDVDLDDLATLEAAGGELPLDASGAGPLEVVFGEPAVVNFGGPVELRMPSVDVVVRADTGVTGSRDAAGDRFAMAIRGAVVVEHGESTLEAPELVIDSALDAEGRRLGRLTSAGPTRTVGRLADGRPFTLTTSGRLVLERGEEGYRLPLAEGVDIDVRGDEPLASRADLVRDFEEEPLSFVAEGTVHFASLQGQGSGEHLRVDGVDRVSLTGNPDHPARFDFTDGSLEAAIVELDGEDLNAREDVSLRFETEGTRYDLSARWTRVDRSGVLEGQDAEGLLVLDSFGDVVARMTSDEGWSAEVASDALRLTAIAVDDPEDAEGDPEKPLSNLEPGEILAEGNVNFAYSADFDVNGQAEHLRMRADGSGELEAAHGSRILLEGRMLEDETRFSMSCLDVEFSPHRLIAKDPDLRVEDMAADPGASSALGSGRLRAVAGHMASDKSSLLLTGGAHISQQGEADDAGWSLYADKVLLTAAPAETQQPSSDSLRDVLAWGGFVANFEDEIQASGDTLQLIRESEVLKITGEPAIVELSAFQWAAEWFTVDLKTSVVRAGPGKMRGTEISEDSWQVSYSSIEPVEYPGETIQVIREPVIESRSEEVRASWALLWVDNSEWSRMSRRAVGRNSTGQIPLPQTRRRKPPHPESLFGRIQSANGMEWLREVYLEGNVTYTKRERRIARADSIYLDLIDGHGWLRRIDLSVDLPFMEERQLKLRARWMRHSADGSFFASKAVATTCGHEEPHYVVQVGDLKIDPRTRERDSGPDKGHEPVEEHDGWQVSTSDTSLRMFDRIDVPLPHVGLPVTPDLGVDAEQLSLGGLHPVRFGSDSKLGNFIGTTVSRDLGWVAKSFHRLLIGAKAPTIPLEGKTDYRASWNNNRGVLLGLTSVFSAPDRYTFEAAIDGLFDGGDDKGLIRVPEDDRSRWRAWYRTRGRYLVDEDEWFDAVLSIQTDAAVQSEFFEGDFLRFEERETFLHWRKASGPHYLAAKVEVHPNDFQSDVVPQEALYARGSTAIAGLTENIPLTYSSRSSLAYLTRELGDSDYPSPFDKRFLATDSSGDTQDGWNRDSALRIDTRHRLETPLSLGFGGIRATPFLEARGTAWDIGAKDNSQVANVSSADNPTRIGLLGGIEFGTTVWRMFENSVRHMVAPYFRYREDIFVEDDDDPLVLFDEVENPIDGRFFDLGVRNRLESKLSGHFLDFEVVQTYADDAADGLVTGWLPLEMHATCLTEFLGLGFGVNHDARYNLDNGLTPYSRTIVGIDPIPSVGIEVGYHSARDLSGQTLYNAMSTGARYAFSSKWELDGRYVFSTQGNGRLSSEFGVRRLGHDFVFQLSTRFREGEGGGTSFEFDVIPLLAYDDPGESLVERWRQRRY